jgi:hypothetical protein
MANRDILKSRSIRGFEFGSDMRYLAESDKNWLEDNILILRVRVRARIKIVGHRSGLEELDSNSDQITAVESLIKWASDEIYNPRWIIEFVFVPRIKSFNRLQNWPSVRLNNSEFGEMWMNNLDNQRHTRVRNRNFYWAFEIRINFPT